MTRRSFAATWDHPRIRGEHSCFEYEGSTGDGSSPHTRGALRPAPHSALSPRIIPAYAGSTGCRCSLRAVSKDHPRIRGEHPRAPVTTVHGAGSSPHTRGARRCIVPGRWVRRIIPAYAGSTLS